MELQERSNSLRDYINIVKRRRLMMLITFGSLMALTLLISFGLPSVYRSTATILLEEQEVSEDFDRRQSATEYADARVYKVQQRALTSINLSRIIDKFQLYRDDIQRLPRSEIIEEMRSGITQDLVSADVIDPRSGRPTRVTIAFDLSFDHRSAVVAQKVANELVDLYRNENIEQGLGGARETAEFYEDQVERANRDVLDLEDRLARFKAENEGALPEFIPLIIQLINKTEKDASDAERMMASLEERRIFLESQLLQTEPHATSRNSQMEMLLDPNQQLELAKSRLREAVATYGPNHPDVKRLRTQVAALSAGEGGDVSVNLASLDEQIELVQVQLIQARQKYSAQHPEVLRLERMLRGLNDDREVAAQAATTYTQMVTTSARVSDQVNVRAAPDAGSAVVGSLRRGAQATLIDSSSRSWNKILLADGTQGFVSKNWTEIIGGDDDANSAGNEPEVPSNPAFIQLRANLASVITQMRALQGQLVDIRERGEEYSKQIEKAPLVEREYSAIMRDLTDRRASLVAYKQELERAKFGEDVIIGQKGQKFTLIEPPIAPPSPHSPNRIALLFLGLVLSLFGTIAAAVISESLDNAVRKASDIIDISGATPLAAIPEINTTVDQAKSRRVLTFSGIGVVAAGLLFLVVVHFAYKPLDVVWAILLRKLGF